MNMAIREFPAESSKTEMMNVHYYAMNGEEYFTRAVWYRIQEALNELSRVAYENNTSVYQVVIN